MSALTPYVLVGLGGFLGAVARHVLTRAIGTAIDTRFPLGTFVINVTGSFALGVLGALLAARLTPGSESLRLALGVGFLGAYTTFSTFEFETHVLVEEGAWFLATANVALSLVAGFVAVRLGVVLARSWLI